MSTPPPADTALAAVDLSAETIAVPALSARLDAEALLAAVNARFPNVVRDPADRWDLTVQCPAADLRDLVQFLRDDRRLAMNMLLDVAGVDYLSYPGHRAERFAVIYLFKSLQFNHRIRVKVLIDEDEPQVPSIHDLYKSADWAERETWDQVGIVFTGHPNLKRLLNHHEFVGHPLRKDYPVQKRQKLSVNDPMLDQLVLRLRQNGFTVLDDGGMA